MSEAAASPRGGSFTRRLIALSILALALRVAGVATKPILPDDRASAESAIQFVERGQVGATMWHHPRLRDLAVYASISTFGPGRVGYVFPSLLLGFLSIPVMGLLGRKVGGERIGLLAALLTTIDPLHVAYSCQAVQDVYTFFFAAAGALLALWFVETDRARFALAAGALFGLGAAAKWSVAFPQLATLGWLGLREIRMPPPDARRRVGRIAFLLSSFVLLPATVYVLTWTPWFLGGRDLLDWVALQWRLGAESASHAGFNPAMVEFPHRAWQWFVMPVAHGDFGMSETGPAPILAMTNPTVWLLTLPAMVHGFRRSRRTDGSAFGFVVALLVAAYVPFLPLSRPIWVHSALVVLPFALILVAALVVDLAERARRPRAAMLAYVTVASLAAAPLYLLATGHAERIGALRWVAERYRPPIERQRFEPPQPP